MSHILNNFINNINLIQQPLIICGKSGSGKTYLANKIQEKLNRRIYLVNCQTPNISQFINNIHSPSVITMLTDMMNEETQQFLKDYSYFINLDLYPKFSVVID
jgi:chromosomal replication initiation ATPase DnaA